MSNLYKKILVPLDGSELAAQALPHAEEIAGATGAELILLQVVVDPRTLMVTQSTTGASGTGMIIGVVSANSIPDASTLSAHNQAMDRAKWEMDTLATTLRHRKIDALGDIDTGDPATQIVDYAAANEVDLIVMSTHGRTGVGRWSHGSVTNKVLQIAPCAVLVVRPVAN